MRRWPPNTEKSSNQLLQMFDFTIFIEICSAIREGAIQVLQISRTIVRQMNEKACRMYMKKGQNSNKFF